MLCQEIMKHEVECLTENDTVQTAARKMRDANIGFMPICDPQSRPLGTLTDRDIAIRVVADAKPAFTRALEVMTREVVACRATDTIERAEQVMAEHQKSRILCVDEQERLVGVISLSDLIQKDQGERVAQLLRDVTQREASLH